MIKLSRDRTESFKLVRDLLMPYLGRKSNGAPAAHVGNGDSIPSALGVSGVLLHLNSDYLTRSTEFSYPSAKHITGVWRFTIINYSNNHAEFNNFYACKELLEGQFLKMNWQPSVPVRNQFSRAIASIEFEHSINLCR